ncbi:uncharacterized protein MELLADRAFT_56883 [Melampsora larici-populina 98AG31]|uniref:Uncharacterized protein n=1 Tax=Melampsora larici-populina (strain 98AG31 / pathotype 3-4-7) TaxID=747676 RepID=F4RVV3_MELLP|nr:uncharacterized protein MELLADRAFT_56883 [Melampsora larici-populina 98AG31]EGG03517.1 hypothetical protein MELLADRAFT_56883 [Melampsora larici-populina 98AG31]
MDNSKVDNTSAKSDIDKSEEDNPSPKADIDKSHDLNFPLLHLIQLIPGKLSDRLHGLQVHQHKLHDLDFPLRHQSIAKYLSRLVRLLAHPHHLGPSG